MCITLKICIYNLNENCNPSNLIAVRKCILHTRLKQYYLLFSLHKHFPYMLYKNNAGDSMEWTWFWSIKYRLTLCLSKTIKKLFCLSNTTPLIVWLIYSKFLLKFFTLKKISSPIFTLHFEIELLLSWEKGMINNEIIFDFCLNLIWINGMINNELISFNLF